MAKKIDLGESPEVCCAPVSTRKSKKPPKYYPRVSVPRADGALDPSMVGKTVTVQVEARIKGMHQNQREGEPVRTEYDLELRSMTPPKATRSSGKGGGRSQRAAYAAQRRSMTRA
jgi:hypothetical protein